MKKPVSQRNLFLPRSGATLVEFGVALPITFLLLFGMVELSRLLLLQQTADTAAYEGARNIIVSGAKPDEAVIAANQLLSAARIRDATIEVSPDIITEETATVYVRVEIPVASNGWIGPKFFSGKSVSSEVTLLCERPPLIMLTGIPKLKSANGKMQAAKRTPNGL